MTVKLKDFMLAKTHEQHFIVEWKNFSQKKKKKGKNNADDAKVVSHILFNR